MVGDPRRSRVISALNVDRSAPPDDTQAVRKRSSSTESSAAVFSLALFQEKYAESLAYVSPTEFRRWWVASVMLHVGCAVFLVHVGRLYLFLPTKPVMWYFELYSVTINTSYFSGIAAAYFCAASVHIVMLSMLFAHSIRQRKIAFRAAPFAIPPTQTSPSAPDIGFVQAASTQGVLDRKRVYKVCVKCWKWLRRCLSPLLRGMSTVHEAFDIRSKYYGATWAAMEVAQTLLQTYQAYRLSALMPRLWMTNVVVALIVLNCWALSIVERFFRSEATHVRLYVLALSLSLDLVSYILVPVLVFLPYQSQYNREVGDFGDAYWYDDVWLVHMINELQLLFVVSLLDGASKGIMALSVPRSLYVLTKLLRERPAKVSASSVRFLARMLRRRAVIVPDAERGSAHQQRRRPTISAASPGTVFADDSIRPVDDNANATRTPSSPKKLSRSANSLLHPLTALNSSRIERWGHRFLLLWGTAVLAAHLHATTKPYASNCTLHSYPWFVSKPTCSLLELDCRSRDSLYDSGGAAEVIDAIIQGVDIARVQYLVIRHCPRLEFPPSISHLPQLVGLKIRDSTIISWNESAALTHACHPELRFLFLGDVNMSTMPEGMIARDFPRRLRDIEMCRVNLTELPKELDQIWPSDMFLLIEQFQFSEFPDVVIKLRANLLSLAFNNFTDVPSALLAMPYTETLILNGNPLVALPSNNDLVASNDSGDDSGVVEVGDHGEVYPSEKMLKLHLVMTDIETLPSKWSEADEFLTRALVNAPHTPLCANLAAEGSEAAAEMYAGATGTGIDCFDDSRLTWYPINSP